MIRDWQLVLQDRSLAHHNQQPHLWPDSLPDLRKKKPDGYQSLGIKLLFAVVKPLVNSGNDDLVRAAANAEQRLANQAQSCNFRFAYDNARKELQQNFSHL